MSYMNIWPYVIPSRDKGISLLPPSTNDTIKIDLSYLGDGRLNFSNMLTQMEREYGKELGQRVALLPKALQDPEVMEPLKSLIIEQAILITKNILTMFTFHPQSLGGQMIPCHIPVKMKGSGMLVSIYGCPSKGGVYELDRLVNELEDSYRKVLDLDSGEVIFSSSQRSVIRQNGTKWIENLKEQYRNHLADKFNYSKEEVYRYKEIKSYSFRTGSITFAQGVGVHGTFTLSGYIAIRNNKLSINVMGETALLMTNGIVAWNGTISLLKNGNPVASKSIQWTNAGIWPHEKSKRVPVGAVGFNLGPPNPKDKWQLKFDVGYNYQTDGSSIPSTVRADKTIAVDAGWVKFPDAVWKINREYEWLNPL